MTTEERGRVALVSRIEEKVEYYRNNPPTQSNFKNFRVADHLRDVKEEDYNSKILTIVALHKIYGRRNGIDMDEQKGRYLQQLLERRSDLSIHKLVEKLWEMKEDALKCYPDICTNPNPYELVKILLLDGCFVIELLRNYFFYGSSTDDRDPLFKSEKLSLISHDLMLVENQLPIAILNMLFEMTKNASPDDNICHLVLHLVQDMFPWSNVHTNVLDPEEILRTDHLLGLVYRCYFPFSTKTPSEGKVGKVKNSCIRINSASELTEAGIRLKGCKENSLSFEGGVLKLPSLRVSGRTESLLRNLMAYEQLCLHENHVTDYVVFVHSLIRSTKDVEILRRSGIISFLGGDAKVYQMFDSLVTNVLPSPEFCFSPEFCYSDVFERVNVHCGRRRQKWRDYFISPWSLIKFFAAAAVLLLGIAIAIETFKHSEDVVKVHIA